MPVRSKVLARARGVGHASGDAIAVVPEGVTWIAKSLLIWNQAAADNAISVGVQTGDLAIAAFFFAGTLPGNGVQHVEFWVAMEPTDQLIVFFDNILFNVWISGAELPGVG